ncbi:uncharacterized protein LOC126742683 isoform X2 [Anthonomus grandis grandis]|uniref:uncharacterized protein LOC126742683 isoform X2 n=1 Tax=Anthonomus grandis grandis TaxID=2921223 RepID=UPI002165601C|nr:uncharacterized protein LOC126742683 isoform X2 [Anthonomus grandis grandis]
MEDDECKILQLSDCALMCILSHLDSTSLYNLSRTCTKFEQIVEDKQLWKLIDARDNPNTTEKARYISERVHQETSQIMVRAESTRCGNIRVEDLRSWMKLQNLQILALENQCFNGKFITMRDFPVLLEELSLKKSHVKNGKGFFQSSLDTMRNLRVLILDQCDWIDSSFFMSIARYPKLQILSIIKCMRLHINVIPYLNVARHGCKSLKIIDSRFNSVANEVLVRPHKPLFAMYFQSMRSYQLDTGKALLQCYNMSVENKELISQSTIKNRSLDQYRHFVPENLVQELPHSVLYEDPYPECTCNYKSGGPEELGVEVAEDQLILLDDYINYDMSQTFICKKHSHELTKLPKEFKNFFEQGQKNFFPASSDTDSDSDDDDDDDDDQDCCMFGVGKSQKMIVLKVDSQGNLPEPQVINFRPPPERPQQEIDVNLFSEPEREQPQPSTSAGGGGTKRRHSGSASTIEPKRARDDGTNNNRRHSDGPSVTSVNMLIDFSRRNNAEGAGPSRLQGPPQAAAPSPRVTIRNPFRYQINMTQSGRRIVSLVTSMRPNRPDPPAEQEERIKLRRLSLRGYRGITDQCLRNLSNLNLSLLDVTYTGVTKEGIEQFLTVNPNCRVVHPSFCRCKPRIPC